MEENESLRRLLCKNKTQPEEDQLNLSETMFSNDIDNTVIHIVKNAEQRDGGQEEIHNNDGVSDFHMKSVDFVKKDKQKIKKHIDNSVEQRDCEQDEVHDDNNGVADLNMKTVDDVKKDKQKTKKH
ncbi:Glutamate--tRNA ligase [Frankliniella fusca]|uniref:Glutamate--tRNA ligase n=1 Tax=Frankliniella fusca TaxID=407009 RepID=A0AAE1HNM7_9NEOP|nr:Glutamate--tRNA ligase [Frankliniella fusca]